MQKGCRVLACGFEKTSLPAGVEKSSLEKLALECGSVILPLPVTDDGVNLKAEYSAEPIVLDGIFAEKMRGRRVFGGKMERLFCTSRIWEEIDTADYSACEEFAVRNAVPTAEGAAEIAMRGYPGTISGSHCLIAGFGRLGRALMHVMKGLDADVTVSARAPEDLAWIEASGCRSVETQQIGRSGVYDIIFNTVPALIFTRQVLSHLRGCSILVDLASSPGGIDFEAAGKFGIKACSALSLPGRAAPKTAGKIIGDIVYRMVER